MKYIEVKGLGWTADPENWEELKEVIHSSLPRFTKVHPKEENALGKELLARFG